MFSKFAVGSNPLITVKAEPTFEDRKHVLFLTCVNPRFAEVAFRPGQSTCFIVIKNERSGFARFPKMYVRFETRVVCPYARRGIGIFQSYADLKRAVAIQDTWQLQELQRQLEWFGDHLNVPDRLFYRLDAKAERSGVCWFKDSAKTYISRARYFSWLLTELGAHVSVLRSRDPGRILWEDTAQVVAIGDM